MRVSYVTVNHIIKQARFYEKALRWTILIASRCVDLECTNPDSIGPLENRSNDPKENNPFHKGSQPLPLATVKN